METVISRDGTTIAFDRVGQGPALVMVTGAMASRALAGSAASALEQHFTVFAYDRRGRGDSGDTAPYAVEREVEDIEAVINSAGGSAFVFGHSSGAVLALEAARLLPTKVAKLAVYEPPFLIDHSRALLPVDYVAHLNELVASGRRGDAVEYFMTQAVDIPPEGVTQARNSPMWPSLEAIAHTIAYDGTIMGDTMYGSSEPLQKWASVSMPTLVMDGGNSPAYMHHAAEKLASILPNARHHRCSGQDHGVADEVLAPALAEFFL
ncbi:MAG TPA: alpha/beta hydrolase [Ktedonobacteraceae bacterium]